MNDESGWIAVTFMVWLLTLISVEPQINPDSVRYAEKLCKDNGGWKHIEEGYSPFSSIKCNNGAEFDYDWTMFNKEENNQ